MRTKWWLVATAALILPFVMLTPVGTTPAWALTTGSGRVSCTAVTGSVKYTPAWSDSDSNAQIKAKIKFTFTSCSGGSPTPIKVKGSGTLKFTPSESDNVCTGAEEPGGEGQLKLTYGSGLAPSSLIGEIWVPSPDSDLQMESGDTHITGSYPVAVDSDIVPTMNVGVKSIVGNCTTGVSKVVLSGGSLYQI